MGIQIQVLRIAKGREHAAQIGGDVLQDEYQRHIPLSPRRGKHEIAQRQKRDQRHIVGNQHGADKRNPHQRQRGGPGIAREPDNPPGQNGKKMNILQRTDHGQRAEKTAKGLYIKVTGVLRVRRHQKCGNRCRRECDDQHGVLANPPP